MGKEVKLKRIAGPRRRAKFNSLTRRRKRDAVQIARIIKSGGYTTGKQSGVHTCDNEPGSEFTRNTGTGQTCSLYSQTKTQTPAKNVISYLCRPRRPSVFFLLLFLFLFSYSSFIFFSTSLFQGSIVLSSHEQSQNRRTAHLFWATYDATLSHISKSTAFNQLEGTRLR